MIKVHYQYVMNMHIVSLSRIGHLMNYLRCTTDLITIITCIVEYFPAKHSSKCLAILLLVMVYVYFMLSMPI